MIENIFVPADPLVITQFVVATALVLFVTIFLSTRINRALVWATFMSLDVIFIVSAVFKLFGLTILSLVFIAASFICFFFVNSGVLRKYTAKPLRTNKMFKIIDSSKQTFDKEKLIENVVTAVNWLSENKVGALITFERQTPLNDFMKSGTIINCPFTPEIVETIFYEGTRLHDGAIIVKNDTIVAAAVYYPPSTKAVMGKFGARHRAALGISEITDSITIVVSEETGRISIAHGGMLDNIKSDEFESFFRNQIAN